MSLKKQIRDLKTDNQKKEEELEQIRKNIKNTKVQEIEMENKTYKDECTRLRHKLEELMQSGPDHPMFKQQAQEKQILLE